MFDTIGIRYLHPLPKPFLVTWDTFNNKTNSYSHKFNFEGHVVNAVYHAYGYNNQTPLLNFYTSLPKLIHTCNHTMITEAELPRAFRKLNYFLASILEFTDFEPVEKARLIRLDACRNFHVGNDLNNYLHVAKSVDVSRRKKRIYATGVQHVSDHHKINIYGKYKQCRHIEAKDIFRVENQLCDPKLIEIELGKRYPTLLDLNNTLAKRLINSALHDLTLDECGSYNLSRLEGLLIIGLGNGAKARNIIHYVRDKNTLDPENLKTMYSRQTKNTYEKILRELHLSSIAIDEERKLPPLKIV